MRIHGRPSIRMDNGYTGRSKAAVCQVWDDPAQPSIPNEPRSLLYSMSRVLDGRMGGWLRLPAALNQIQLPEHVATEAEWDTECDAVYWYRLAGVNSPDQKNPSLDDLPPRSTPARLRPVVCSACTDVRFAFFGCRWIVLKYC